MSGCVSAPGVSSASVNQGATYPAGSQCAGSHSCGRTQVPRGDSFCWEVNAPLIHWSSQMGAQGSPRPTQAACSQPRALPP